MKFLSRKLFHLYTKLRELAVNNIHKFVALNDKEKKKILLVIALVALSNFAYSLFSLYTLISFGIAFLCIGAYLKINLDAIKAKGLITYMPPKLQKALLQRSIFDIICDIWFIPKISIYFKAFILPLFIKIDPSEAIHQLEDLSIGTRKLILTKGILNIMPNTVKTAMLPAHQPATAESDSSDESPEPEDQRDLVAEKNETSKSMHRVDSKKSFAEILFKDDTSHSHSHKTGSLILDSINNDSNIHHKVGVQNSTDEEGLVNHNISLSKQMELKKSLPSFADMNPLRTHLDYSGRPKTIQHFKHQKGKPITKGRWSFLKGSEDEPLSQILNSSRLEKGKNSMPELSETWDRLEIFARKHREKQLRQKHIGKPKKTEAQGVFQAVQNIASLLSKDAIMERLEEVNLFKVFLLSSLALLLHFTVSKKTKYWFYYALQIMMYVTGITLSTGSMALYIVKVRTRYRQWKEEQEKEKEKQKHQESLEREDSD